MATRKKSLSPAAESVARTLSEAIRSAVARGLLIDQPVKIGSIRGVVIGYNIARKGRYPGWRYPLLVKTELGTAKFSLDEVSAA